MDVARSDDGLPRVYSLSIDVFASCFDTERILRCSCRVYERVCAFLQASTFVHCFQSQAFLCSDRLTAALEKSVEIMSRLVRTWC